MHNQAQLPLFPDGVNPITEHLVFKKENGVITYFNYLMPVFMHNEDDIATFRMITSQFCINGNTTQAQISRAFGVSLISLKRSVKLYREKGPKGFYEPRNTRGTAVLTEAVLKVIQEKLYDGISVKEIASELNLKSDTINKAIRHGKLHKVKKKTI